MRDSLSQISTPIEINNYEYVFFNEIYIRIGIKEHFSYDEIRAYEHKKLQYNFIFNPLEYYECPQNIKRSERQYSYLLAFYRRISLPLEISFSIPTGYHYYPIDDLKNFQTLNNLFEKYYDSFQKLDVDNSIKKSDFKDRVIQTVFKLWLSGYGLFPNYTDNCITEETLNYLHKKKKKGPLIKVARFLSFTLSNEELSPVKKVLKMKANTSFENRELAKWSDLISEFDTDITQELFNFTFKNLRECIDKSSFIEYKDDQGILIRESLNSISDGTWIQYSSALLKLCILLNKNYYFTIESCLYLGLEQIMTYEVPYLSYNSKSSIRIACKHWLTWYTKTNGLKLNITRIIPPILRNKEKSFGRMLNFGATQLLIETLLDDACPYFDENNIADFRARRACLLQLATGQRSSEICYLLYNCLHDDNMGVTWLYIHKTKNSNSNKVLATPDIKRWIRELQSVAPSKKILISPDEYPYGDNLEEYRLLGNMFDDGPFLTSSMNKFLNRIQRKLWQGSNPNMHSFSTHDLRRMHALYMRLKGREKHSIQDQLGHENINSQLPYLATKPLEHQKWFEEIQSEGVYKNITVNKSENTVDLHEIIDKTLELSESKYNVEKITNLLVKVAEDVQDFEFPKSISSSLPTGFPLRIHSCNATSMINCGHTELHCFSCNYYKPDLDSLEDHKTELFRYMLLVVYQDKESKKTKDLLEREMISFRSNDINNLIKKAFNELSKKFNLENTKIKIIREELHEKSLNYIKKYYKTKPNPSFYEARNFIVKGELIG
ncbi:site-specific integrase [Clostridium sp. C8-1-8]|uniref:site-specific integrase n=1 Tax=Clostridium sp. C8-1-8 TaxID=2698831 RepID=UPI00136CE57A|nr:site-specific integrase [Clostridium sp. C8-1-8]